VRLALSLLTAISRRILRLGISSLLAAGAITLACNVIISKKDRNHRGMT